jgi:hypothetical protein
LMSFIEHNIKPGSHVISGGWKGYCRLDKANTHFFEP